MLTQCRHTTDPDTSSLPSHQPDHAPGRAFPRRSFPVSRAPQRGRAFVAGGRPRLTFDYLPRRYLLRGCRPFRAYGEVRAHIAPGKLFAAAPTAFHPRPRWAPTLKLKLRPRRSPSATWGKIQIAARQFRKPTGCGTPNHEVAEKRAARKRCWRAARSIGIACSLRRERHESANALAEVFAGAASS
jgi:hypothetical protein